MAKKKFYRPVLYGVFLLVKAFFWPLPYRCGLAFAGFIGRAAFRLVGRERKKTLEHLSVAFPHLTLRQRVELGERTFRHYGYIVAELAQIEKSVERFARFISISGSQHFDTALAQGRGVIAVTAHFGNWEILGGYLSYFGYPGSVIARRLYLKGYDRRLVRLRASLGLETLYRDGPVREVLGALKRNRVVGFVADQDVEAVDGVFVDFFGKPAFTPSAPVRLALKTGAPLIPLFIIREGRRHRIVIEPPVELSETGDKQRDLVENTQKWVKVQERYIRQYPHLWVWNHKRWKTNRLDIMLEDKNLSSETCMKPSLSGTL